MNKLPLLLCLLCAAGPVLAANHAIEGLVDVVFLDNYNPVVVDLAAGATVELIASSVLLDATDPASLMQQVIVFQATYSNPCGYFYPLAIGQPLTSVNSYVKLFIPTMATTASGTATVRVGSQVVIVDAIANGIPVAESGEAFSLPAGHEGIVSVFDSSLSFGGLYGGSLDIDKVLFFVPYPDGPGRWVMSSCRGETSLSIAPFAADRNVYGFVVDHQAIGDNSGAVMVNFETNTTIGAERANWGHLKVLFR
ncbi:MAG: hypothetical protein IPJ24_16620 [bacterium]|nr:hypothetical protein [bacterium]